MLAKQFITGTVLLVLANSISAEYMVDAVCTLVPNGVRISSIDSCQRYYICNNGKATSGECPEGTKFSKNSQACLTGTNVDCYIGETTPCAGKSDAFVPKAGSCNEWIYCKAGQEINTGTCPNNLIFSNGECRYGNCPKNATDLQATFTSICEILPNNKYFGSTKDCSKWQICRNEKLQGGFCKDSLVFDSASASCVYQNTNTCARVTGENVQPDAEVYGSCTENGALKPSTVCSDYLKCVNGQWSYYSCATNYFFDTIKQSCMPRLNAVTTDCDRCQFSKQMFVNAVDEECRKYLICENSAKKGSNSCQTSYYFDETSQACVKINGNNNYAANNGACYVAPSSTTGTSGAAAGTGASGTDAAGSGASGTDAAGASGAAAGTGASGTDAAGSGASGTDAAGASGAAAGTGASGTDAAGTSGAAAGTGASGTDAAGTGDDSAGSGASGTDAAGTGDAAAGSGASGTDAAGTGDASAGSGASGTDAAGTGAAAASADANEAAASDTAGTDAIGADPAAVASK